MKKLYLPLYSCNSLDQPAKRLGIDGESDTAMAFPLLLANAQNVVQKLAQRKIIATNWWGHVKALAPTDNFEYKRSDQLVQLPTDQRYDTQDMDYMAQQVLDILKEEML